MAGIGSQRAVSTSAGRGGVASPFQPQIAQPQPAQQQSISPLRQVPMGGGGASSPAIIQSVQNMLSQPAQAQVPAINNVATVNPQAQEANNILMQRAKGDMGASDAMRLSGVANADQAAMLMADAGKNASRRGVGTSGASSLMKQDIANNALRTQAGENSKIAFNSERAKDAQFGDVRGGALAQDAAQNDQRRLALSQYETATNAALGQQRLQQEKLRSVLDLLGPMGGFF